jgi:hypothetical protein
MANMQAKTSSLRGAEKTAKPIIAAAAGLLLAGAGSASRADVDWEASILSGVSYIDNIQLAPPGEPQEADTALQLTPRLRMQQRSPRLTSSLDYMLTNYFFASESDFDNTSQQAIADVNLNAVREWLDIAAEGAIYQQIVDPAGAINSENVFVTANEVDTKSGSITPSLLHRFSLAELSASYRFGVVRYEEGPEPLETGTITLDNSENRNLLAGLGSPDPDATVIWILRYQEDETDYDISLPYRYETARATLGYRLGRGFGLIGEGGKESDLALDPTAGGLDATVWRGGIRYDSGGRNTLVALYGERFFGETYEFIWTRRARRLELEVAYIEEPTTEPQRALGRAGPTDPLVPGPELGVPRLTPEGFLRKRFDARVGVQGARTELSFTLASEQREYLGAQDEEQVDGIDLRLMRRLSPKSDVQLVHNTMWTEYRDTTEATYNRTTLTLNRRIGPTTTTSLSLAHFDRWGFGPADYKGWFVNVQLLKRFGEITPPPAT